MKNVLIVGAGKIGETFLKLLHSYKHMPSIYIIDHQSDAPGLKLAKSYQIPHGKDWSECTKEIGMYDIIINTIDDGSIQNELYEITQRLQMTFIPNEVAKFLYRLFIEREKREKVTQEKYHERRQMQELLESIIYSFNDAISVVDKNGNGLFINPAYTRLTGLTENDVIGKPASTDIIEGESMHMEVLRTKRPVRGVRLKIGPNKKEVIVNVAPVIVNHELKGSVGIIHDVSEIVLLTNELKRAKERIRNLESTYTFSDIITQSSEMTLALEQAKVGAKTSATVLLRGQSGTGKELFAHVIHNESKHQSKPFIRVNCASISELMLEKNLFGYVNHEGKQNIVKGLFEEADKGTIFLAEIDELSLKIQEKLLHAIQNNEIFRVGSNEAIPIDVRIIATTSIHIEKAIQSKTFSEKLYYHINRIPIFIPSLKDRLSDIPYLVEHLIEKLNHEYGRNVTSISNAALERLYEHDWPGNVRELENTIGRAMIYMGTTERVLEKHHLPSFWVYPISYQKMDIAPHANQTLEKAMEQFEREYVLHAYRANDFNKTRTAKALNISIRSLYYKIDKYHLEREKNQE
ncbi:PAS domain S-box protein [Cerasibacillus terrae]|uniref:PAS domain S-box protein n=1 Tax=Cerasibacillus terrae TaxID=2498845 RepID=A0A5C8P437_9BACI|nr:sigma 54-interacting transcriptional regulator [Cerasibacillus terrae]TXL67926.1 PAS domain S-box protein [Cerasibacillus terrae]